MRVLKSVALLSAIVGILASTGTAWAGPKSAKDSAAPDIVMIQGTITNIQGNWVTVKTLDWQPSNAPGSYAPQYVIAGTNYRVNVAHAIEETFSGSQVKSTLYVGETIVAVGVVNAKDNQNNDNGTDSLSVTNSLMARVVEQVAGSNSSSVGATTTAASIRVGPPGLRWRHR